MRQDLGRKTDGNTLDTLCEKQRELDREVDRFRLATVVTPLPRGDLVVICHFERKLRESRFDITWSSCRVASEDVTPVSLTVDEQVLLSELHKGIANRSITVRVILHGLSDDVGNLVESPIVDHLHCMQDATLHRLQAIGKMRHGTLQDDIRRIVEKPVLEHTTEVVYLVFAHSIVVVWDIAIARSYSFIGIVSTFVLRVEYFFVFFHSIKISFAQR